MSLQIVIQTGTYARLHLQAKLNAFIARRMAKWPLLEREVQRNYGAFVAYSCEVWQLQQAHFLKFYFSLCRTSITLLSTRARSIRGSIITTIMFEKMNSEAIFQSIDRKHAASQYAGVPPVPAFLKHNLNMSSLSFASLSALCFSNNCTMPHFPK